VDVPALLLSHKRLADGTLRPGLQSFPVGEYVIIYRLQDEDVLILRVLRDGANAPRAAIC
jgi:plasmid stabilization system protein ParE